MKFKYGKYSKSGETSSGEITDSIINLVKLRHKEHPTARNWDFVKDIMDDKEKKEKTEELKQIEKLKMLKWEKENPRPNDNSRKKEKSKVLNI